jgi:dTDP-glucose 4,6-dehydratase
MKILVTGGSGFIGSNFIRYLLTNPEAGKDNSVINLDKLTYAGQGKNLEHMGLENHPRYTFIKGDICDGPLVERIFRKENPELVFNFAAESHVDRSIENATAFVHSNVEGTATLLEAAKTYGVKRFVQISTDEVYGSRKQGSFSESDPLHPSSPYAASKAAADLIALSYHRTHEIPLLITRSANNYGPFQFPEKILSLFITNLIEGKKVPLMWSEQNPGLNVRDWLYVLDNCRAIWHLAQHGKNGEIYNIPGNNERQNIEMTKILLDIFGVGEEMIEKISHRKGHDYRYSISGDKLKRTGFQYQHLNIKDELKNLAAWYKENADWWGPLKNA